MLGTSRERLRKKYTEKMEEEATKTLEEDAIKIENIANN
jgi:hypothetical protein